jgi:DNA topoisomerase IA
MSFSACRREERGDVPAVPEKITFVESNTSVKPVSIEPETAPPPKRLSDAELIAELERQRSNKMNGGLLCRLRMPI